MNGISPDTNGIASAMNGTLCDMNGTSSMMDIQSVDMDASPSSGLKGTAHVSKHPQSNGVLEMGSQVLFEDGKLLQKLVDIIRREKLYGKTPETDKVVDFVHPEELTKLFTLEVDEGGCQSEADLEHMLEAVVKYSVKTQHPHFYNQLYGGIDEVALTGAWLLEAINTNQHTFEAGPVLVAIEHCVLRQLINLFGFKEGDGIFCPGGSIANMYAMVLARHRLDPTIKSRGLCGQPPLYVFTSDQGHYSVKKAASWLGLGMDNVVAVESTHDGVMTGEGLRKAVEEVKAKGGRPYFVSATAGTTVFGAFDKFAELADVCRQEGMWLHVDACWGGSVIFSKKHNHVLNGIERADSLSWNPHKMLCVPLQCSVFLTKEKELLKEANSAGATYLFQQDKFYDVSYDTGDKSIQCGRKGDALKLWFVLKVHGVDEIERRVDAAFEASRYLKEQIQAHEGFELVTPRNQCTNICFWYIPQTMRGKTRTPQWWDALNKVAPMIKESLVKDGALMIGYQPLPNKGLCNFFRMVNTCYPVPTEAHMDYVLQQIEKRGPLFRDLKFY